jgi:hypothetical protein
MFPWIVTPLLRAGVAVTIMIRPNSMMLSAWACPARPASHPTAGYLFGRSREAIAPYAFADIEGSPRSLPSNSTPNKRVAGERDNQYGVRSPRPSPG